MEDSTESTLTPDEKVEFKTISSLIKSTADINSIPTIKLKRFTELLSGELTTFKLQGIKYLTIKEKAAIVKSRDFNDILNAFLFDVVFGMIEPSRAQLVAIRMLKDEYKDAGTRFSAGKAVKEMDAESPIITIEKETNA